MSSARFVSAAEAAGGAGVVMAAGVVAVAAGGVSVEPAFHDASVLAATAMGLAAAMEDGARERDRRVRTKRERAMRGAWDVVP